MFKPKGISTVGKSVLEDIKKELRLQGHYDLGELENSMIVYEASVNNEIILQAYASEYIMELEEGVPAGKIKINDEEFKNLSGWVSRKIGALTPGEATSIAAAIVRKWKKEGKPLPGSSEFSATGEILHAVRTAFENNETQMFGQLDKVIFQELDNEFDKTKSGTI